MFFFLHYFWHRVGPLLGGQRDLNGGSVILSLQTSEEKVRMSFKVTATARWLWLVGAAAAARPSWCCRWKSLSLFCLRRFFFPFFFFFRDRSWGPHGRSLNKHFGMSGTCHAPIRDTDSFPVSPHSSFITFSGNPVRKQSQIVLSVLLREACYFKTCRLWLVIRW